MKRFLKSKYKIGEQIGDGPFSISYKGTLMDREQPLVIKIYKRRVLNSPMIMDIKRKVRTFVLFDHPNIVKVLDGDYGWQGFYFIRDYVDGESLSKFVKTGTPLEVDKAVEIELAVCEAIKATHENDIVHGSLSPNNVFIDRKGTIKVTDFAIEGSMRSAAKETAEELFKGGGFLSPERIKGSPPNKASDIYCLGLLLYYMLTSKRPYTEEPEIVQALKLVTEDPKPPSKLNPKVPAYLDEIVLKALNKDPLIRFDIGELISSLKAKSIVSNKAGFEIPSLSFESTLEEAEKFKETKEEKKKTRNWLFSILFWSTIIILALALISVIYNKLVFY